MEGKQRGLRFLPDKREKTPLRVSAPPCARQISLVNELSRNVRTSGRKNKNKSQVYKRVNKQDVAQEGVPRLDAAALDSTSGVR